MHSVILSVAKFKDNSFNARAHCRNNRGIKGHSAWTWPPGRAAHPRRGRRADGYRRGGHAHRQRPRDERAVRARGARRSPSPTAIRRRPRRPSRCAKGRASAITADVTKETDVARMIEEAMDRLGGLDGLVLNVGVGAGGPWLEGTTRESWDKVLAINLTSHMLSVKTALPKLAGGSSIVFISSIAGPDGGQPPCPPMTRRKRRCSDCAAMSRSKAHGGHPRQRRGTRIDGHLHRPPRLARTAGSRDDRHPARPPGHGLGDGLCRAVPDLERKRLHHGAGARRRRRVERIIGKEIPMALIVYEHPLSPYAQKVKIALDEEGHRLRSEDAGGDRIGTARPGVPEIQPARRGAVADRRRFRDLRFDHHPGIHRGQMAPSRRSCRRIRSSVRRRAPSRT